MRRWFAAIMAGLACVAGGWWAGRTAVTPQTAVATQANSFVLAEVREATVGRALPYGVTVSQQAKAVARNALPGVVVSIHPGRRSSGDTAYVVGGTPVRVVTGTAPFYRDLSAGARGADVRQLESALVALDLLTLADTKFDSRTTLAVRKWQKRLGQPQTGSVPLGEIVAVPALPSAITLAAAITPGAVLSGGEESVLASVGARTFALELGAEQARLVPNDALVQVKYKERAWPARIVDTRIDAESHLTRLILASPDGGPVCGSQCSELPPDATVQLSSEVFVVPQAKGPAVPAAAVQSAADGSTFVLDDSGKHVPVVVKGAGSGLVVVDGLAVGQKVRVTGASGAGAAPLPEAPSGETPLPTSS